MYREEVQCRRRNELLVFAWLVMLEVSVERVKVEMKGEVRALRYPQSGARSGHVHEGPTLEANFNFTSCSFSRHRSPALVF